MGLVAIEWAATDVQVWREDSTMGSTKVLVTRIGLIGGLGFAVAMLPFGEFMARKAQAAAGGSAGGVSGGSTGAGGPSGGSAGGAVGGS
ncbi:MAG: hypothetical protein H7Z12_01965, partial [Rhodospirillaceae bacterium]|nr:hypothetical protein [Rhodospirillales bacterium]